MTFSTPEQAMETYAANLDWENSLTQARNALQALRYLKVCRPASFAHMNSNLSFSEIDTLISKIESVIGEKNRLTWTVSRPRFL